METEERLLVEQAKTDPRAFGVLYDRYERPVYRLALSMLHNPAQAEDVTAEVFVKALRAIGAYRDRGRPFHCWLYQIARNTVANEFRTRATTPIAEELRDAGPTLEDQAMQAVELAEVWRAVDRLPAAQRTAMLLKFREDLSLRTVAQMMGRSEPAVKQLIFRAVQRLRLELAAAPADARAQLTPSMS